MEITLTHEWPKRAREIVQKVDAYINKMRKCDCNLTNRVTLAREDYAYLYEYIKEIKGKAPKEIKRRGVELVPMGVEWK